MVSRSNLRGCMLHLYFVLVVYARNLCLYLCLFFMLVNNVDEGVVYSVAVRNRRLDTESPVL